MGGRDGGGGKEGGVKSGKEDVGSGITNQEAGLVDAGGG